VGQSLEAVRALGPFEYALPIKPQEFEAAQPRFAEAKADLDVLVTSSAVYWPSRSRRS
jgi:hypothetical protein